MKDIRLIGSHDAIAAAREVIEKEFQDSVRVDGPVLPFTHADIRRPQGLEPLVYFVVVFLAHVSAAVTHDYIKDKIKKRLESLNKSVEIE